MASTDRMTVAMTVNGETLTALLVNSSNSGRLDWSGLSKNKVNEVCQAN